MELSRVQMGLIIAVAFLLAIFGLYYVTQMCYPTHTTLTHNDKSEYQVIYADSPFELVTGLSHTTLPLEHDGLVLVYPSEGQHTITTKPMSYNLTLIGINSKGEVVQIEKNVPTGKLINVSGKYVLELPANREYDIEKGDRIDFGEKKSRKDDIYGGICRI